MRSSDHTSSISKIIWTAAFVAVACLGAALLPMVIDEQTEEVAQAVTELKAAAEAKAVATVRTKQEEQERAEEFEYTPTKIAKVKLTSYITVFEIDMSNGDVCRVVRYNNRNASIHCKRY